VLVVPLASSRCGCAIAAAAALAPCTCVLCVAQEAEVLTECDDLLKKLGMKGSLFGAGDNPLAKLQQELEELERMEQEELLKQQKPEQQQQDKSQS
jgi:hypothetical protein